MTNKVRIFISVVLLVIPIFFLKSFESTFVQSKELLFRILVLLFISLSVVKFIRTKKFSSNVILNNKFFLGLLSLFVTYLIVTILSPTPLPAFYGSPSRGFGMLTVIYLAVWYLICATQIRSKDIQFILSFISIASFFVGIYAIFQKLGYDVLFPYNNVDIFVGRSYSTLGNPSYLGQFMSISFFISLYLFLNEKVVKFKYFFGFSCIISLFALFTSESRAAILALIVGLILSLKFIGVKRILSQKKASILVLALLLFTVIIGLSFADLTRFQFNSFALRSLDSRFNLWNSAIELIASNPFGHGLETFRMYFQKTLHADFFLLEENLNSFADRIHNESLGVLFTGGIFAFLCYIYLFLSTIYTYFKTKDSLKITLSIIILVSFIQNQFSFFDFSSAVYILFFLAILSIDDNKITTIKLQSKFYLKILAVLLTPLLFLICKSQVYEPYQFQRYYGFHSKLSNISYEASVLSLKTALAYFPYYSKPWFDLIIIDASSMQRGLHYLKQIDTVSPEVIAWEANYYSVLDIDKSIKLFEELIKINPDNPHWIRAYGDALYKNDRKEEALVQYQRYLKIVPEFWKWKDDLDSKTEEQQRQYRIFFKNVPDFWNTVNRVEEIQSINPS